MNFALELFLASLALIYCIVVVAALIHKLQSLMNRKR